MMNLLATIVGLFLATSAQAEFQVPKTPNPVNDYSHVLTRGGKERIATAAVELKKDVGAQVGVLIVDTLDGTSLEEASMAVAKSWGLGSSNKDDGVLIFVVVKDRKMRVEVGKGLEGILTDYDSKKVTSAMKSGLRSGNYDEAILSAITTISSSIKAHQNEITSKTNTTPTDDGTSAFFVILALFGLGGIISLFLVLRNKVREERERAEREARRISRQRSTPEQTKISRLMYDDVQKHAKKDPAIPKEEPKRKSDDDDDGFVSGVIVGSLLSGNGSGSSSDDGDSGGGFGGGSDSSDSGFGGGGGDFGGGGSSDSF